jgi:ABC-type Zn uptake system ZnuABC Zn-binding protein ZnuA
MRRSYLFVIATLALPVLLMFAVSGCSNVPNFWTDAKAGQKKVLVSFPPLYSFAYAVGGDDAYVLCLMTATGPHGHDVAATDMYKIDKADLFIYNGLSLDDQFANKMMRDQKNKSLFALNIGAVLEEKHHDLLLHGDDHDHDKKGDDKHDKKKDAGHKEDGHHHGEHDPHVWLAPDRAIVMTKIIADKLAAIDSAKASKYQERQKKYEAELKKLDEEGKTAFKGKKIKMVTMHDAFDYFASAFDIDIVDSIQKRPGQDPDQASLNRLVKKCKEENVTIIAVEPQYPEDRAEALKKTLHDTHKLDVQIIRLDPMETAELGKGQKYNPDPGFYIDTMKKNIANLKAAVK